MRAFIILLLMLFPGSIPVRAEEGAITVDLASDHVDITTGFNGTMVGVFGVRREGGEIAVVVRGPLRDMTVRRKRNIMGAWINGVSVTYKKVPSYYNFALSKPLDELAPVRVLKENGIGSEHINLEASSKGEDSGDGIFREALLRNKKAQRLFPDKAVAVKFLGPDFFRADFNLPANVPVGKYEVQTFYISGGKIQNVSTNKFKVEQVGINASVNRFAHEKSLIYGFLCVLLALFAGWISNRIRRG